MYKCPKCDYTSEAPGTCPTDNEVLQEVVEGSQPAEPAVPETPETPEAPETTTEPEGGSTPEEGMPQ